MVLGDQRQVQHRRHVGVRIAVSGRAVAGLDVALGHVELRLVGDVADHAGLGAGAEQRALRTFQHLDAIQVGGIDVEVAIRQLAGLIVQIDGDVRAHSPVEPLPWLACEPALRPRMKTSFWPGPVARRW